MIGGNLNVERYTTVTRNVSGRWLNSQLRPLPYAGAEVGVFTS